MLVEEYLEQTQEERQSHLDLESDCIERGGNSTNHRGVLAQYLNTEIYGRPADLCHACHNGKCSNPNHLYWGTRKENIKDAQENGTWKTAYERVVDKYGPEKARQMSISRLNSSKGGKNNKGKVLTEEHKAKIAKGVTRSHKKRAGVAER